MTISNFWNPLKVGLLLAGLAVGLTAAMQDDEAPKADAPRAETESSATGGDAESTWRTDFDQALALAAKNKQPALLRFTAKWCPPCQVMDRSVFSRAEVKQALADRVVPVVLDIDLDENQDLAWRYRVQGVPTMVLVDADGKVLNRAGFLSAEGLLRFLGAS